MFFSWIFILILGVAVLRSARVTIATEVSNKGEEVNANNPPKQSRTATQVRGFPAWSTGYISNQRCFYMDIHILILGAEVPQSARVTIATEVSSKGEEADANSPPKQSRTATPVAASETDQHSDGDETGDTQVRGNPARSGSNEEEETDLKDSLEEEEEEVIEVPQMEIDAEVDRLAFVDILLDTVRHCISRRSVSCVFVFIFFRCSKTSECTAPCSF